MTKEQFYQDLGNVNHSREKRQHYAQLVIRNPELLAFLFDLLLMVDDKRSCKAAWVFEFVCDAKLEEIFPHLDRFAMNLHKIHLDSAVRPVAKVCEYLVKSYYSKSDSQIKLHLSEFHKQKIVEACFDWLINDEKIAPKAYAMQCLYLLGRDYKWIHPELAVILERDYAAQSSGFKARARHILKKIEKS